MKNTLYEAIKSGGKTLLIFDYDGTLTPIVDKPDNALLNPFVKDAIESLAKKEFLRIAIVTGREISALKRLSELNTENIMVYGLHGGEVEIEKKVVNLVNNSDNTEILRKLTLDLKTECKYLDGVLIEEKKHSVALHYRQADENTAEKAVNIFNNCVEKFKTNNRFKIQSGKKVLELLPADYSKDKAVRDIILKNPGYIPFYFGDDITDIVAFKEVKKAGGYAIGMSPLPFNNEGLTDFEISQEGLANFIIKLNQSLIK